MNVMQVRFHVSLKMKQTDCTENYAEKHIPFSFFQTGARRITGADSERDEPGMQHKSRHLPAGGALLSERVRYSCHSLLKLAAEA
jgi:hypothetical protein